MSVLSFIEHSQIPSCWIRGGIKSGRRNREPAGRAAGGWYKSQLLMGIFNNCSLQAKVDHQMSGSAVPEPTKLPSSSRSGHGGSQLTLLFTHHGRQDMRR